ncbi:MAG: hypothetical protein ACYCYP_08070 [Leptospirales bacterium]
MKLDQKPSESPSGAGEPPLPDPHGNWHHASKILVMVAKAIIGLLAFGYALQYTISHV